MTRPIKRFLLVDDDPLNNSLTKIILKQVLGEVYVNDFTLPEDGLEFINSESIHNPQDGKTTFFLDINMPYLSGWEFLEAFDLFDTAIKEQYDIYILSSSVAQNDIDLAKENPYVIDFIEKPLNKAKLTNLFG